MIHASRPRAFPSRAGRDSPLEPPNALTRVVVGAVLGFLGVGAVTALMCWAVGISVGPAVGVGAFVALFGGAGFGAMMGGSVSAGRDG